MNGRCRPVLFGGGIPGGQVVGKTDKEGAEIIDQKATVPATLSPVVQTQMLRKDMNFKGLIVTDAMGMSAVVRGIRAEGEA